MGKVIQYGGADLYPKQREAIFDPARISIIEATPKAGKGAALDSTVYTPNGPVRMGSIQVGDYVSTPDGGSAAVRAIYPLGERDLYKVTFGDGTALECTEDHLWEVHGRDRQKWPGNRPRRVDYQGWPRLLELRQIADISEKHRRRMWIPTTRPVSFVERPLPINPYLLGVLLGDGSLTGSVVSFGSADAHIIERVRQSIPAPYTVRQIAPMAYNIAITASRTTPRPITAALKVLGVWGKRAWEKFIPDLYRYSSEQARWEILRGLFDTDGFVDSEGQPAFCSTSKALAYDLVEIVQSLGCLARVSTFHPPDVKLPDGSLLHKRRIYWVVVRTMTPSVFFSLPRKIAQTKVRKRTPQRMFREIAFSRRAEAQCIEIDSPDGLYLMDNFAVTHNTVGCLAWMFEQAAPHNSGEFWWLAPVFQQSEIGFRRMADKLPRNYRKTNQSKLSIKLVTGPTLWFKSADRAEDLFGEDVRAAVLDEASRMREEAWLAVATTLTYTKGPIRIIGNVRGRKNWFYQLARLAEQGLDPEMAYHRITALDAVAAGVLDPAEIERARKRYANLGKEGIFKQLYTAEAHDESDNPFGLAAIEACLIEGETMTMRASGESVWDNPADIFPRYSGVDLAGRGANNLNAPNATEIERDFTAVCLLDREGTVVHLSRFRADHAATQERVLTTIASTMALVDSTGAGDQQVEAMQKRVGPRIEGYLFTQRSRQDLLEGLALAIADGRIRFPDGPLRDELDAFEFNYSRTGERWEVPPGVHDDLVFALALAVKKLPYRRSSLASPIGVPKPGGSIWSEEGASVRAEPGLLGDPRASEPDPAPAIVPAVPMPIIVRGGGYIGASKWRGSDR